MPAKKPRVNIVVERPMYDALGWLARRDGVSLSTKARDLLNEALENLALAELAAERERSLIPAQPRR
jgi:hypothetical protein